MPAHMALREVQEWAQRNMKQGKARQEGRASKSVWGST